MVSRLPRYSLLTCLLAIAWTLPAGVTAHEGPRVYQPGTFSTGAWDFFVALTPDLRTAYICRANGDFSYYTILETSLANGRWTEPRIPPFSGRWSDADPHLSPEGSKLFFISKRPLTGDTPREEHDIWVVEREAGGRWGTPRNLYFGTVRDDGKGGNDLYMARWTGDGYAEPRNLVTGHGSGPGRSTR